jgi:hypothetical protein
MTEDELNHFEESLEQFKTHLIKIKDNFFNDYSRVTFSIDMTSTCLPAFVAVQEIMGGYALVHILSELAGVLSIINPTIGEIVKGILGKPFLHKMFCVKTEHSGSSR